MAFADVSTAVGVAELLNLMAYAQDRCDRTQYELALDEYAKRWGFGTSTVTGPAGDRRCVWTVAAAPRLVCPDGSRSAALS